MNKKEYKKSLDFLKLEFENQLQKDDSPPFVLMNEKIDLTKISLEKGLCIEKTIELFNSNYKPFISNTAGPNYFGFVVGGSTPVALLGDSLSSLYDQISPVTPVTQKHELDTLDLLKNFFELENAFDGSFVTGATMSNFVNLATARQWIGLQYNEDWAMNGITKPVKVLSSTAHSSVYKSLSMLGLGRNSLISISNLPNRESMDINELELKLQEINQPVIVCASAGTVNTGDFDNIQAIVSLKEKYNFWLHVDAAFGGFAALSNNHKDLLNGWNEADSITIDLHKWLNVPYDSAIQFTKHKKIQSQVFQNGNAPYLENVGESFLNLTPENSRRWRSLSAWFSLVSYGKNGYQEIVERHCNLASFLGNKIETSTQFELLSKIHLNIICFKLNDEAKFSTQIFMEKLNAKNVFFVTSTIYQNQFAIRVAICNWQTEQKHINKFWETMNLVYEELINKIKV